MPWEIGSRIENRWQVRQVFGGGFGLVYIVYDPELQQAFAVKTIHEELDDDDVYARFQQETHSWLQLGRHPHVVQAHFLHSVNGKPLLFLEYVSGGDLARWIGSPRLLEDRRWCLQLALDLCDGLEHAYSHGIRAHRDLKPANCLLTDDGRLKVTDFGLVSVLDNPQAARFQEQRRARSLAREAGLRLEECDPTLTGVGASLGTVTHMPPEQFRDAHTVDARADIYSFGVMLFQMLTGHLPFTGQTAISFLYHHAHTPPPTLEVHVPEGVGEDLQVLVASCLAKEPEARPPSFALVRQVLADMYRRVAGEPAPEPLGAQAQDAFDLSCKGISLVQLGLPEAGLEILDQAVHQDPTLQAAWVNRSLALQNLGRNEEAVTSAQAALKQRPFAPAWHLMANALSKLGRDREAAEAYDRSLQLDPRNARTWTDRGLFLAGRGALQKAAHSLQQALRLADHPRSWTALGMVFHQAGQSDEALKAYSRSLSLDERQPVVWTYVGDLCLDSGLLDKAGNAFERALELDENLSTAWLGVGRVRVKLGDYAGALPVLKQALERDPGLQLGWYVLGSARMLLGQHDEAVEALRQAVSLDPEDGSAWNNLGACEYQRKRLEVARECFGRAARLGLEDAAANYRALSKAR